MTDTVGYTLSFWPPWLYVRQSSVLPPALVAHPDIFFSGSLLFLYRVWSMLHKFNTLFVALSIRLDRAHMNLYRVPMMLNEIFQDGLLIL
jgi:hypothetical protein